MGFLQGTEETKGTESRTIPIHEGFSVTIVRPTQAQRDQEQEAGRKFKRGNVHLERGKWARKFAENRVRGWTGLTLAVFDDWLRVPVKPAKRKQVEDGFAAAPGGELPYSRDDAAHLIEHALEDRLVKLINEATEDWDDEVGADQQSDDDKSA